MERGVVHVVAVGMRQYGRRDSIEAGADAREPGVENSGTDAEVDEETRAGRPDQRRIPARSAREHGKLYGHRAAGSLNRARRARLPRGHLEELEFTKVDQSRQGERAVEKRVVRPHR